MWAAIRHGTKTETPSAHQNRENLDRGKQELRQTAMLGITELQP